MDAECFDQLIQTNLELIQDTKEQNQRDFDTCKMWIKQSYNQILNLIPKDHLERNVEEFLSEAEIEALLADPSLAIEFFKQKFKRDLFDEEWEDEVEYKHVTPPKLKPKNKTPPHNTQPGFRNKPATNLNVPSKNKHNTGMKNKPVKRFQ